MYTLQSHAVGRGSVSPLIRALCVSRVRMKNSELLNNIESECDALAITLYEHSYSHQAFGSWSVVAGKPHHRMRFSWDGKESYLGIAESEFTNSVSSSEWQPVFPSISGTQTSTDEVLGFIINQLLNGMPHNKLLKSTPATKSVASAGQPTLRFGCPKAKCFKASQGNE